MKNSDEARKVERKMYDLVNIDTLEVIRTEEMIEVVFLDRIKNQRAFGSKTRWMRKPPLIRLGKHCKLTHD